MRIAAVCALLALSTGTAHADVSTPRRIGAVAAAIFPGVLVRGTGSYLVGEKQTAKRLALVGYGGLASMALGGGSIIVSGASEYTVPAIPFVILGMGAFFPTWFADIAVAAGAAPGQGTPRAAPPWSFELGTVWLHDPFRARGLVTGVLHVELGRVGFGAAALLDTEGDQHTEELEARYRLLGPAPTAQVVDDGSHLHVAVAGRHHRDAVDAVTLLTAEVELRGRYDLANLDAVLDGQFIAMSAGIGIERAGYPRDQSDLNSVLLAGFGYGWYVGRGSEVEAFYEHRRDSITGGIAAGRAAGFVGSVGLRVLARLSQNWAVRGEVEVGNAWVTTFGIRYEGGPR